MKGLRIKELASLKGVKIKDVALAIDMKPTSIYNLNAGTVKPSFDTLMKLRDYFGKPMDALIPNTPSPAALPPPSTSSSAKKYNTSYDASHSGDVHQLKGSTPASSAPPSDKEIILQVEIMEALQHLPSDESLARLKVMKMIAKLP